MKIKINIKPITVIKTRKPDNLGTVFTKPISLGATNQGVRWGYFDSEFAKWVISYYKIPLSVLKFMGVELMQRPRHFKLVPKK